MHSVCGWGHRQPFLLTALLAACLLSHPLKSLSAPEAPTEAIADSAEGFTYVAQADPTAPIVIGPRAAVGTDTAGEKVAKGVVGGVLGSVLGGSRERRRSSDRPDTERDPTRKLDYVRIDTREDGVETAARAQWTEDGLLVSARVEDSPDQGTFQAIFLQTCDGRRLYPARFEIYKLWGESGFSVSWSRTSSVDGEMVSHDSGAWSDQWSEGIDAAMPVAAVSEVRQPATWRQLGFNKAHGGARQLGAHFNISPAELAEIGAASLFVHATLPAREPVSTAPAHWLIRAGQSDRVELAPADVAVSSENAPGSKTRGWWGHCNRTPPPLLASSSTLPLTAVAATEASAPLVQTGYAPPPGVVFSSPRSTGRTTGHIATITVANTSDRPVELPPGLFYIPSTGRYQGYVGRPAPGHPVPPGATREVPVEGYCASVRLPPVPAGEPMPPLEDWIVSTGAAGPITVPPSDKPKAPGNALIPGTDTPLPRAVDADAEPLVAAPLLIAAIRAIERATAELQQNGELQTPSSTDPERERETVNQQTLWIFAAELENEPYSKDEFIQRLEAQYEDRTGVPITAAPEEDREQFEEGAEDFWDAFELVGVEAKVIRDFVPDREVKPQGRQ